MQKLLYLGILVTGVVIVLSGLSIWKPVQFHCSPRFFGGYDTARYVHFCRDDRDRGVPRRACAARGFGAEEPARHDFRPLRKRGKIDVRSAQNNQPGVDPKLLIKDAAKLLPEPSRRLFLRGAASLGALAMLTGCDIIDGDTSGERAARRFRSFNDRRPGVAVQSEHAGADLSGKRDHAAVPVQRLLRRGRCAGESTARSGSSRSAGCVDNKKPWTLAELNKLPQVSQITRHVCVEGWSAIGSWQGVRLSDFLKLIGADTRAKYVWFQCAEGYSNTIDMPTALHPQTQLTLQFDHKILPRAYGFPMKIRIPTKLGFKNPKYVTAMWVQNNDAGGYWENQGYNWFSGL